MIKAESLAKIKKELSHCSEDQLLALCLRLAKHKTENKELLSYLLFHIDQEDRFVEEIKAHISGDFVMLNQYSAYFLRKGIRKILRETKKYIRYSQNKKTSVELLIHFCAEMKELFPYLKNQQALINLYETQLKMARKEMLFLHEDLQHDYLREIENLKFKDSN